MSFSTGQCSIRYAMGFCGIVICGLFLRLPGFIFNPIIGHFVQFAKCCNIWSYLLLIDTKDE